jgi:hypothetical protein
MSDTAIERGRPGRGNANTIRRFRPPARSHLELLANRRCENSVAISSVTAQRRIHFDEKSTFRQLTGARVHGSVSGVSVNLISTYPPDGASSRTSLRPRPRFPSQRMVLRRLFRETIPDCTLQCGPTKRGLSTCLAKRSSLCVSSIRLYSRAANMRRSRSASNASAYRD